MQSHEKIEWQCKAFSQLHATELYRILSLRNEVFVVEQNCVYQDCDGKDLQAYHLCGYVEQELVAYARLLPAGVAYDNELSIGRIVTSPKVRGRNYGRDLVASAIKFAYALFGKSTILIGAQAHLTSFYGEQGFVAEGKKYLEDGIPHIQMRLSPQ